MPEIPEEVIRSFGGSLGAPPAPHLATLHADRLRSSDTSATLARRIMADIEVLARRASHAKERQGAVPLPTTPDPPDYFLHLQQEAPLRTKRARWDRPHLHYAIWRQRQLAVLRLAQIGTDIARRLELLAKQKPKLTASVAQMQERWPVNLQLEKADKNGKRKLLRSDAAKAYLCSLKLNSFSYSPIDDSPFAVTLENHNPPRVAVEQLVRHIRSLRDNFDVIVCDSSTVSTGRVAITTIPSWATGLMKLRDPIDTNNVEQWWSVAREFLNQLWDMHQEAFRPLINRRDEQFLDKEGPTYRPSKVKNPIVNYRLKKAFQSLAIRPRGCGN